MWRCSESGDENKAFNGFGRRLEWNKMRKVKVKHYEMWIHTNIEDEN